MAATLSVIHNSTVPNDGRQRTVDLLRPRLRIAGGADEPLGTGVRSALLAWIGEDHQTVDVTRADLGTGYLAVLVRRDYRASVSVAWTVPARLVMPIVRHMLDEHLTPGKMLGVCTARRNADYCPAAYRWLREMNG